MAAAPAPSEPVSKNKRPSQPETQTPANLPPTESPTADDCDLAPAIASSARPHTPTSIPSVHDPVVNELERFSEAQLLASLERRRAQRRTFDDGPLPPPFPPVHMAEGAAGEEETLPVHAHAAGSPGSDHDQAANQPYPWPREAVPRRKWEAPAVDRQHLRLAPVGTGALSLSDLSISTVSETDGSSLEQAADSADPDETRDYAAMLASMKAALLASGDPATRSKLSSRNSNRPDAHGQDEHVISQNDSDSDDSFFEDLMSSDDEEEDFAAEDDKIDAGSRYANNKHILKGGSHDASPVRNSGNVHPREIMAKDATPGPESLAATLTVMELGNQEQLADKGCSDGLPEPGTATNSVQDPPAKPGLGDGTLMASAKVIGAAQSQPYSVADESVVSAADTITTVVADVSMDSNSVFLQLEQKRAELEQLLGESRFLQAYQLLQELQDADDDDAAALQVELQQLLSDQEEHERCYQQLLHLVVQESAYFDNTGRQALAADLSDDEGGAGSRHASDDEADEDDLEASLVLLRLQQDQHVDGEDGCR